jgi:hypothetical protein
MTFRDSEGYLRPYPWLRSAVSFPNEAELANHVLAELDEFFMIEREVHGAHCSGRRLRLDAVLRPREVWGVHDPHPALGVEFKNVRPSMGLAGFTRWAAQAMDYAHTSWDGYDAMMIFTCPPVTGGLAGLAAAEGWLMAHLLGQVGVGELGKTRNNGWTLRLSGENVWTQRYGPRRSGWHLTPKAGSR